MAIEQETIISLHNTAESNSNIATELYILSWNCIEGGEICSRNLYSTQPTWSRRKTACLDRTFSQEHTGDVTTEPSLFREKIGCSGEGEPNFDRYLGPISRSFPVRCKNVISLRLFMERLDSREECALNSHERLRAKPFSQDWLVIKNRGSHIE